MTWVDVDNALSSSIGGLTVDDVNGAPPAVTDPAASVSPSFVHVSWASPASTTDVAGVEVRYALGSTPPATVTDGLDGGRLLTTSRDLGPLPPDQDVAISVFSRDWSGHVGPAATTVATTPHTSTSTLTATASPGDIVYGHSSTIGATLTRAYDHAPLSNMPVTVATRPWKTTGPFVDRTTILTDAAGKLSYLQIPGISYDYELRYAGDADYAATTATTRIRVAHRVTDKLDHASAPAGTYAHLTATVAPSYPDGKTYLQKYTTRAVTLGPDNTGATSKVTYTIKAPAKGTKMKYRVAVPSGGSYLAGYGAWLTVTGTYLAEAFRTFDADPDACVAVLWGAGGTFCAGADLQAIARGEPNALDPDPSADAPMGPSRLALSKPVVATVSGHAVAGGLELALWCDLRVVERDAVLGVFCRRWGVPLIDGGTVRLPRTVGRCTTGWAPTRPLRLPASSSWAWPPRTPVPPPARPDLSRASAERTFLSHAGKVAFTKRSRPRPTFVGMADDTADQVTTAPRLARRLVTRSRARSTSTALVMTSNRPLPLSRS